MSAIIMIHEPLSRVIRSVNRFSNELELNLKFWADDVHHQDDVAIWSVDDLLIKATETGEQLCELEAINFQRKAQGFSRASQDVWHKLVGTLTTNLRHRVEVSKDSERLARKTLVQIPPFKDKEHEKWKEDQGRAEQLSVEEAVAKLFEEEKALKGAIDAGADRQEQDNADGAVEEVDPVDAELIAEMKLATLAKEYGIRKGTARLWQRMRPLLIRGLDHSIIAGRADIDRRPRSVRRNINKMKKKGYWDKYIAPFLEDD